MSSYEKLYKEILKAVGGEENINSVAHFGKTGEENFKQSPAIAVYSDNVDSRRAKGEQVWLLSAGDAFAGSAFGTLSNGLDVVTIMNMVGYEAMVLGNHEHFMIKSGNLGAAVAAVDFPVLSVNTPGSFTAAVPGVEPYLIYEFGDIRIAVIGLGAYGGLDAYEGAFTSGDEMVAAAEAAKSQAEAEGTTVFIGPLPSGYE